MIRVSGPRAIEAVDGIFAGRTELSDAGGYTVHFGEIVAPPGRSRTVDEVLVTVFRAPHSYTGEDSVEISCHASPYIVAEIIGLLTGSRDAGCAEPNGGHGDSSDTRSKAARRGAVRLAEPGEFTVRAFLAGKMDLSQAEAVADLIASSNRSQHDVALNQMRGGISTKLADLREELVTLASLLELELDFGEEDVEFASRERLKALADKIGIEVDLLIDSFSLGNAIKEGVPVAIVGRPNAGKSTLLNALVGEDRAMVSEIAGTTRDRIEEVVNIGGVEFRFIDTAGLRHTDDILEKMGIDRTLDAVRRAFSVLLVVDGSGRDDPETEESHAGTIHGDGCGDFASDVSAQISALDLRPEQRLLVVVNKMDSRSAAGISGNGLDGSFYDAARDVACNTANGRENAVNRLKTGCAFVEISARTGENLEKLRDIMLCSLDFEPVSSGYSCYDPLRSGGLSGGSAVVSSARHHAALVGARAALECLRDGFSEHPADLLAEDIRDVSHHLGLITGAVTTDEILGSIFSKFCIGK